MNIEYSEHLPNELREPAIRLYFEVLKEKLAPILDNEENAVRVLKDGLAGARCLTAVCDGKIAGIMGIQTTEGSFINPRFKSIFRIYGPFRGIWRICALLLLAHAPRRGELYIDGIAVSQEMRGRGIGTQLLTRAEVIAARKGLNTISLDVTGSNQRAKALYTRLGFAEEKRHDLWPFNVLFGFPFRNATFMAKQTSVASGGATS